MGLKEKAPEFSGAFFMSDTSISVGIKLPCNLYWLCFLIITRIGGLTYDFAGRMGGGSRKSLILVGLDTDAIKIQGSFTPFRMTTLEGWLG